MPSSYKKFPTFSNLFCPATPEYLEKIRKQEPLLFAIDQMFDFQRLRPAIEKAAESGLSRLRPQRTSARCVAKASSDRSLPVAACSKRGRSPCDPVLMFKICLYQCLHRLSDAAMVNAMQGYVPCMLFLDLNGLEVPQAQTIWKYREIFTKEDFFKSISEACMRALAGQSDISCDDVRIMDSSFVEAPVQHNTAEENKLIKKGLGETLWKDQPNKRRHKDIDARWSKKGNKSYYGYKLHTKVAAGAKLILSIYVTPANVHDSQVIAPLFDDSDHGKVACADAAYGGREQLDLMKSFGLTPLVCSGPSPERRAKAGEPPDFERALPHRTRLWIH